MLITTAFAAFELSKMGLYMKIRQKTIRGAVPARRVKFGL